LIKKRIIFEQIRLLTTEQRNSASMKIDDCSLEDILKIISKEDKKVASIVEVQIPFIKKAVKIVVKALKDGGRLIYVGAGSSGRLGVLDAVECPPTYGTEPKSIQGVIAGGEKAMFCAQEGVEDKEENGVRDIDKIKLDKKDVVCGIAASLRTPYVMGAVKRAKKLKAQTIYITTNPRSRLGLSEFEKLSKAIDVAICPDVGPEVIMGSTRMKSGTAQKLVLNMITTAAMIKMGKVYENMMIDLQPTNKKLIERSKYIIMTITGVSYKEAEEYLTKAKGKIKTALVMIKAGVNYNEAVRRLKIYNGFVKAAIQGKRTFVE
jgi:N-acetylmuramic acid 6-phosphate etherase